MRIVMYCYAAIFALLLIGNTVFWIKSRGGWKMLLYELFSGGCIIAAVLIYFTPAWTKAVNPWLTLLAIPVIAVDFYMSVIMHPDHTKPPGIDVSESEIDIARIISLIFEAPGYITAALLMVEKWRHIIV
ncbi:hypothetical protein P0136_09565 [Lentisphaerota bacterium ZTH]|nr:hypothetical protein JYG24_12920 [Lentisphaerota bacterium]WET05612.1 hypothetical protein P0136_09565 [Lentisphaerota bacterium ZTH]